MSLDKFTEEIVGLIKEFGQVKTKIDKLKNDASFASDLYFKDLQKSANTISRTLDEVFIVTKQKTNPKLCFVIVFYGMEEKEFLSIDGKTRTVFFEEAKRFSSLGAKIKFAKYKKEDPSYTEKFVRIKHIKEFTK